LSVGARCDATQRTMLAMLAVEQYRRTHGAVPDTLDQLVPDLLDAVPVDPFDGLPLRYAYTPRDYVIYSIGRDGVDNGGNVDESDDGDAPTDVGVRIELPESTGEQLPAAATEK